MIKEKVKYLSLLMLMCCVGLVMTSCGDDDDEPAIPQNPSFSHVKAVFSVKAEGETTQCFDITGEWECNGEVMAMAPLKVSPDQSYKPADSKNLPSTYSVTLNATPNPDFVPEAGKRYSAKIYFTYSIQVIGTDGTVLTGKEGGIYVLNMEGIRTDKLDVIARRFPKNYKFTVKHTADGGYEITDK